MKRDPYEFFVTLLAFIFSLVLLIIINNVPNLDDTIYLGLINIQVIGIVTTLTAGFFNKGKK